LLVICQIVAVPVRGMPLTFYTELLLGVGRVHYGEREELVVCTERGHHV